MMHRFADRRGRSPLAWRAFSAGLSFLVLYYILLPDLRLYAQDYRVRQQDFQTFEQSLKNLDRYVDRAERTRNEQDWDNYVELGVATEFVAWEREALDVLQLGLDRIATSNLSASEREAAEAEARASYTAAREVWEDEADLMQQERRGEYRARLAAVEVAEIDVSVYAELIAQAEAAAFAEAELSVEAFDLALAAAHGDLETGFEDALAAELDRARLEHSGLDPVEQQAFEDELARVETQLRQEFEVRDHFFIKRARNRLIALQRSDDLNARLAAESENAETIAEALLADTQSQIATDTNDMLAAAVAGVQATLEGADNPDLSSVENNWETQIEAIINRGLEEWQRAEEDLYASQLAWERETKTRRETGTKIWKANYEKLTAARSTWLEDVQDQIQSGRTAWDAKFAEFAANRAAAETELADYVQIQRERWAASSRELSEIVNGGSSALLEAQDGLRYYDNLLAAENGTLAPDVQAFYTAEADRLRTLLTSFGSILAESEGVLQERLHSGDGDSGLLVDRRQFARDLPVLVAGLDVDEYRDELTQLMADRGEDFVLYRRDMEALVEANALFTARTGDLAASDDFDPAAAGDLATLRETVAGLERAYDDHRVELLAIVDRTRDGLTEAERLSAVKSDIAAWLADNGDENQRLRRETVRYFQGGAAGYYLSGDENDPYLLTEAELQWEMLRRERNYLAKRLNAARAVKEYADKAFLNEAGLEMAAVTAERAEMAKAAASIKEIAFRLIRGDFTVDPAVATDPAVRLSERDRLLAEHDVDWAYLEQREIGLQSELDLLAGVLTEAGALDTDFALSLAGIDGYLNNRIPQDRRDQHPLALIRTKLLDYRDAAATATDPEKQNRLTTLSAGVSAVRDMLAAVRDDFDFAGMRADQGELLTVLAEPNLKQHQAALDQARSGIEANALLLQEVSVELKAAQAEYRRARVDFEALRSGNAADLLNAEVRQASNGLNQVLNRMAQIEDIPALAGTLRDEREAGELRYLNDISENRRLADRESDSRALLEKLEGLELARTRRAVMEEVIAAHDPAAGSLAFADELIARESELVLRDAANDRFESHYLPIASLDRLKDLRRQYDDFVATPEPPAGAEFEERRATLAAMEEEIRMAMEGFFTGLRAEEATRRKDAEIALHPDANPVDLAALGSQANAGERALDEYTRQLAADAARELESFLGANREQSYAQLLSAINDAVATAAADRQVRTADDPFAAAPARPDADERAYKVLVLVRDWVLSNRVAIERANQAPGAGNPDPRTVAAKWDELLVGAGHQKEAVAFQADFEASRPADASDPRVLAFQSEREALRDAIALLLTETDADLFAAYQTLPADTRGLIDLYATGARPGSLSDPAALRAALTKSRSGVVAELAALPTSFRAIIDREDARLAAEELDALEPQFTDLHQRVAALEYGIAVDENEKAALEAELAAETDPLVQAELQARIDALDLRLTESNAALTALQPQADVARARYLELSNLLRELEQPGSSSFLGDSARASLRPFVEAQTALNGLVRSLEPVNPADAAGDTMREELGAILGVFETDAYGDILRDAAGDPRVSQEFRDLNIAGVSTQSGAFLRDNLNQVLAGGMRGDHLALWAERLQEWTYAHRSSAEPELLGAIELVQESLREYRFAEEILRTRNDDTATLVNDATARGARAAALAEKIKQLQGLEARLNTALADAAREERDPLPAALQVLEAADVPAILQLFDGYDLTGAADGVIDPELAARAADLARLRDQLIEQRRQRNIIAVQEEFAAERASLFGTDAVGRSIQAVLDAHPELDAADRAMLVPLLREIDRQALRDRDLTFENDITSLITDYAGRATTARAQLQPLLDAIAADANLNDARVDFLYNMDGVLAGSAFASIRRELRGLAGQAASIAELKSGASAYLATLVDPTADELDLLNTELAERELRTALVRSDSSVAYQAADYPAELRDFILTRAYARGAERTAAFRALHDSDRADQQAAAVLDLRGISGDVGAHFLLKDFDDYFAGRSPVAYLAERQDSGGASLAGYLQAYLIDRNTDPALLPPGAGDGLFAREAHREYLRLQSDIGAAGSVAGLDPADYFQEFNGYLFAAKFEHFAAASGYTHAGATRADREAALRTAFEAFLADAAYALGGRTLAEQLPTDAERENLFALLLTHLEYGADLDGLLPGLADRAAAGTLDEPLLAAEELLPADLTAIPNYDTADYRALAALAGDEFRAALARVEVLEAAAGQDLSLYLDDAELEGIVLFAGQSDLDAAARAELVALLRNVNLRERAGSADRAEALRNLRREQAYDSIFPDEAAREGLGVFMAASGGQVDSIEEKFFAGLDRRNGALRVLAKEQRGALLASLGELIAGRTDALYDGAGALLKGEMDLLAAELAGTLSAAENTLLQNESAALRDVFDYRSAQELIDSGIIESVEAAALRVAYAGLAQTEAAAVRARPDLASRALMEAFVRAEGLGGASDPDVAAFVSSVPGLGGLLDAAAVDLNPNLRATLRGERVMIARFYDRFQERAADRAALARVLADPAAVDPAQNLSFFNGIQTETALLDAESLELSAALSGLMSDHARQLARRSDQVLADREMARRLLEFAEVRGKADVANGLSRFEDSRFMNFRTYAGLEEQAFDTPGDAPELADRLVGGGDAESLLGGDYHAVLRSDPSPAVPGDAAAFNTVSDNRDADMSSTMARRLYYENLANNFLDATTNLNRALNRVVAAGDLAQTRRDTSATDLAADVRAGYDLAETGAQSLDAVRTVVQQAAADSAVYSAGRAAQSRAAAVNLRDQFDEAGQAFARAGRRTLLMNQQMDTYLERVFQAASDRMQAVQQRFEDLQAIEANNRVAFADLTTAHIEAMNRMGAWIRDFQTANDEFEIRRAVREFAETPYLFATAEDSYGALEDGQVLQSDARAEYELARAALDDAQTRLEQAGQAIAIQDNLVEFAAILDLLENGPAAQRANLQQALDAGEELELAGLRDRKFLAYETLLPDEETRLTELSRRAMYARNASLIGARADYIRHEMQAVRVQKASEVIAAEVERRQAKTDLARQSFEQVLARMFGSYNNAAGVSQEQWEQARNAVHLRLAEMVETDGNFYDEYRAWYQIAHAGAVESDGNLIVDSFTADSVGQIAEKNTAVARAGAIDAGMQESLKVWMSAGGMLGQVGGGFSGGFVPVYSSLLNAIGVTDERQQIKDITYANWEPTLYAGLAMMALGYAAGFFQWWLLALIPIGAGMVVAAESNMSTARKELEEAQRLEQVALANAQNQAAPPNLSELQTAMERYARALGDLEYFTKVPDMRTLKERVHEWGAQHDDETAAGQAENAALYSLQDGDLRYLVDQLPGGQPNYIDRNGAPESLNAREQSDALDVTAERQDARFTDAYGNAYDPNTVGDAPAGLQLQNGTYMAGGVAYVRIKTTNHDGSSEWKFARKLDEGAGSVTRPAYDMTAVLAALADRSHEIAGDYRADYFARGDALLDEAGEGQRSFVLNERDDTLETLFARSAARAEGGREFGGYGTVYEIYSANGEAVFNDQLSQNVTVQRREWDLRAAELQHARESWERKIETILERGKRSFADSENLFLAQWRQWEREMDAEDAAGQKVWDEKIAEHFTARQAWSEAVRTQSGEVTIEAVVGDAADRLNAQLAAARSSLGADIASLDKTAIINAAIDDMKSALPSASARKYNINSGIKEFNTLLSAHQVTGGNFAGDAALTNRFKKQLEDYGRSMKVLANVQMFEQFQQLERTVIDQIDTQNQAIADRTAAAAMASGFTRGGGGLFTKDSGLSGAVVSVNPYEWFDVARALRMETEKRGLTYKSGQDLVDYLDGKSEVEVASFFDVQRLALQTAMQAIMGSSHPSNGSRDIEVIGQFWAWAGTSNVDVFAILDDGLDEEQSSVEAAMMQANFDLIEFERLMKELESPDLSQPERNALASTLAMLQREIQERQGDDGETVLEEDSFRALFNDVGGFGQLGGATQRNGEVGNATLFPWASGASATTRGFFPQLREGLTGIAEADNKWREDQAALDPFTAIVNSFNPWVMVVNAKQNYEVQTEVYGMDKGEALSGAFAAVGKGLLAGIGTALLAATGVGASLATAIALSMVFVSNSIRIDAQGGASFSVGADTFINTALTAGTAAFGGGLGATSRTAQLAGVAASSGLIALQSAIRYDESGNVTGIEQDGARIATDFGVALGSFGLGRAVGGMRGKKGGNLGGYLGEELGQQSAITLTEYGRYLNGEENYYAALANPDLQRLGVLTGGYAGSRLGAKQDSREANRNSQEHQGADIIRGFAYGMRRRSDKLWDGLDGLGSRFSKKMAGTKAEKAYLAVRDTKRFFGNGFDGIGHSIDGLAAGARDAVISPETRARWGERMNGWAATAGNFLKDVHHASIVYPPWILGKVLGTGARWTGQALGTAASWTGQALGTAASWTGWAASATYHAAADPIAAAWQRGAPARQEFWNAHPQLSSGLSTMATPFKKAGSVIGSSLSTAATNISANVGGAYLGWQAFKYLAWPNIKANVAEGWQTFKENRVQGWNDFKQNWNAGWQKFKENRIPGLVNNWNEMQKWISDAWPGPRPDEGDAPTEAITQDRTTEREAAAIDDTFLVLGGLHRTMAKGRKRGGFTGPKKPEEEDEEEEELLRRILEAIKAGQIAPQDLSPTIAQALERLVNPMGEPDLSGASPEDRLRALLDGGSNPGGGSAPRRLR